MNRQSDVKTHELVTWKGRTWSLTEWQYKGMNERLEAGAKFLTIPDDSQSKVSVSDIKFFGRRQMTMSDMINESKALPQGEIKFNPLSPGYIKFIAMSIKMGRRNGTMSKTLEKITDEQRPLINEQLEKMGIEFRV